MQLIGLAISLVTYTCLCIIGSATCVPSSYRPWSQNWSTLPCRRSLVLASSTFLYPIPASLTKMEDCACIGGALCSPLWPLQWTSYTSFSFLTLKRGVLLLNIVLLILVLVGSLHCGASHVYTSLVTSLITTCQKLQKKCASGQPFYAPYSSIPYVAMATPELTSSSSFTFVPKKNITQLAKQL